VSLEHFYRGAVEWHEKQQHRALPPGPAFIFFPRELPWPYESLTQWADENVAEECEEPGTATCDPHQREGRLCRRDLHRGDCAGFRCQERDRRLCDALRIAPGVKTLGSMMISGRVP
jgi:hypothetical protein